MKRGSFFIFFLSLWLLALPASLPASSPEGPRLIVHLLDYLAQDYGGAVAHGKILSDFEYREQLDFVRLVRETEKELPEEKSSPSLREGLQRLESLIVQKADAAKVSTLARSLQAELMKTSGLQVAPSRWPDLVRGGTIYAAQCVSCHGIEGKGNGPASQGLEPPPANFHEKERMKLFTPLKGFNAIRIGIPGTAMAAFSNLSDEEIWDLAFYVASFPHQNLRSNLSASEIHSYEVLFSKVPLTALATSTDSELAKQNASGKSGVEKEKILSYLRNPAGKDSREGFQIARQSLEQTLGALHAGQVAVAKQNALRAYLEGVEPLEAPLRGKNAALVLEIERKMGDLRGQLEGGKPLEEVSQSVASLNRLFDQGEALLREASSPWFVFLTAGSIILREGFEAILIIVSILGVLRAIHERRAARWVHGGWVAALLSGLALWALSAWLVDFSGAQREVMEGVAALAAVTVLLYVGFWLHNKTEIHRWTAFIDGRTRRALATGNLLSLAFISFAAVFREAFETVLFLQALSLDGRETSWALGAGILVSLVFIFTLAILLTKFSVRVPIRKLFSFSSLLMAVLAVVLAGKGVYSLQEMGWVSMTPFPLPVRWDFLGLYPTVETLSAQGITLLLVLLLWWWGKRPNAGPDRVEPASAQAGGEIFLPSPEKTDSKA